MKHEQGYTDGGRNPHYDGLFDGETDADKERRRCAGFHREPESASG
jgi:hypothetical protein